MRIRSSARALLMLALAAVAPAVPARAQTAAVDTARLDWWQLDPAADSVRGIGVERAYRELLAGRQPKQTVVVAIIDSGVDIDHPDLRADIWTNLDEIPGNGKDDDDNGYVDDVHGWDFIGGPDGRDVDVDTYELTRVYAALKAQCEDAQPAPQECSTKYPEIREQFQQKREETNELYERVRSIDAAMDQFEAVLKRELDTDTLTMENVGGLRSLRPEVLLAKENWMRLVSVGATSEEIKNELEELEKRAKYSLNPDFDPRSIVGDHYADTSERIYGNAEVEGPDPMHGTHVAGIIGAVRDNSIGINGVANGVKLMVVRAVPDGDERDKDVANAIRYAVDNGAKVVNMSFGKGQSPQKAAVDEAVKYAAAHGVLLVHAAGNEASDNDQGGNFPTRTFLDGGEATNWIEVGASSWTGVDSLAAPFSNYGAKTVDVFAPGMAIYSTVPNGEYRRLQGTSMASPVVAGVAALLLEYHPELTPEQVRQIIIDSATRFPDLKVALPGAEEGADPVPFSDLSISGGVVNVYNALKLADERGK